MTISEIRDVVQAFADGARRCAAAGFDVLDIHGAHGYLLHSFYSPLGNDRTDAYGGSRQNRMRLILEVTEAVRAEWPADKPLFVRLSCIDGEEGGWSIEDTVALSTELVARGVDLIDCSSRGIGLSPTARVLSRIPGFQVPFADRVRREVHAPAMAVGLIMTGARRRASCARAGRSHLHRSRGVEESALGPSCGARGRWRAGLGPVAAAVRLVAVAAGRAAQARGARPARGALFGRFQRLMASQAVTFGFFCDVWLAMPDRAGRPSGSLGHEARAR